MKLLFRLLPSLSFLLLAIISCEINSERKLIGDWKLRAIEMSSDNGETWTQYSPGGKDFLRLHPDGKGACGDPTGTTAAADDVVWSLKGDSIFYYSPKWKQMFGETRARIIKCDKDSLILEMGNRVRYIYLQQK